MSHPGLLILKINHYSLLMPFDDEMVHCKSQRAVIHNEGNGFRVGLSPPVTTCILFLSHSLTKRFLPAPKFASGVASFGNELDSKWRGKPHSKRALLYCKPTTTIIPLAVAIRIQPSWRLHRPVRSQPITLAADRTIRWKRKNRTRSNEI